MDSDPGCVVNLLIRVSSASLLPSGGLSEVVSHSDSEDVATRCVLKSCNLSKRPGRAWTHSALHSLRRLHRKAVASPTRTRLLGCNRSVVSQTHHAANSLLGCESISATH